MEKKYWPFEVLPPAQRNALHSAQIDFMEAAYREGWRPYKYTFGYSAETEDGREASIIQRSTPSQNKWEVVFCTSEKRVATAFLSGFQFAAEAALRWLKGEEADAIISGCKDHLFSPKGAKGSFTILPDG